MVGIKKHNRVYLNTLEPSKRLQSAQFLTFDIETKDGLKGKELFSWAVAFKVLNGGWNNGVEVMSGYKKDFFRFFEFIQKWKHETLYRVIYVHNLSFDIRFIIDYLIDERIDYTPIISGSNMIACIIDRWKVKFIDSVQFLQSSQEKAEIEWDIPEKFRKGNVNFKPIFEKDFNDWTKKEKDLVYKHNKLDVIALWHIMNKFRKTMFEISKVDCISVISLAMLSMKAFRTWLGRQSEKPILNPFLYKQNKTSDDKRGWVSYGLDKEKQKFVRQSYYGGRNEVFDINRHKNLLYMDRVSMYPAEMFYRAMPSGYPSWRVKYPYQGELLNRKHYKTELEFLEKLIDGEFKKKVKIQDMDDKIIELEVPRYIGFIKAKISKGNASTNFPIVPKRLDKRVMFTDIPISGVYTSMELEYARKKGYTVIPEYGLVFNKTRMIFHSFVKEFYRLKANNTGGRKKSAKILLNSLYGKFGQEPERKELNLQYFVDEDQMKKYINEHKNPDKLVIRFDAKKRIYMVMESIDSINLRPFMIVSIASTITAYERLSLTKLIHTLEDNQIDVIYADTDSVVIPKKEISMIKNLGDDLGCWGVEKEFDEVQFVAPKAYMFKLKNKYGLKLKGVAKDKIKQIVKQSASLDEMEELIREPIELAERYMKFKESHRYGQVLASKKVTKHYSFENLKRMFNRISGKSIPWNEHNALKKYRDELQL